MPTPRATSVADVLKKTPILIDETRLEGEFPTDEEKTILLKLSQQLHDAAKANEDVEKTWTAIASGKAVALKVLGMALR